MAMVRYQMFIDEEQKRRLDDLHRRLKVPVAELVRRAIDRLVVQEAEREKQYPTMDEETRDLLSLAGICEGGPSDLADGHDRYLHGDEPR
jgi:hypothetical protein